VKNCSASNKPNSTIARKEKSASNRGNRVGGGTIKFLEKPWLTARGEEKKKEKNKYKLERA